MFTLAERAANFHGGVFGFLEAVREEARCVRHERNEPYERKVGGEPVNHANLPNRKRNRLNMFRVDSPRPLATAGSLGVFRFSENQSASFTPPSANARFQICRGPPFQLPRLFRAKYPQILEELAHCMLQKASPSKSASNLRHRCLQSICRAVPARLALATALSSSEVTTLNGLLRQTQMAMH